jgi:hypothetical protein
MPSSFICPIPGTVRTDSLIQSNIPQADESPPNSKKAFSTIGMLPYYAIQSIEKERLRGLKKDKRC